MKKLTFFQFLSKRVSFWIIRNSELNNKEAEMRKNWITIATVVLLLTVGKAFSQGPNQNGHHHGMWPDSLETVTVTGTVIVDSSFSRLMYYLDENGDEVADYHLSFGPWWYQPESGATRPTPGETVTIVGVIQNTISLPTIIVFEIDGLTWRAPVRYGMYGWNGEPFWNDLGDTLTVTGMVLVDTTYFYQHYFLDSDGDSIPEYKLGFGPPWYEPESGASRPEAGETVTVFGRVFDMMGIDLLTVYVINGLEWRPLDGPAPWAGIWMQRDISDTTYAYCVNDSTSWIGFSPGFMGPGMGGMMWPDSSFVQFWKIYPDSLPGPRLEERFMGFYLNVHDPAGESMMGGRFGGRFGRMRFEREQRFRFQYYDEDLETLGLSEDGLTVQYWDGDMKQWVELTGFDVDTQKNTVTFTSATVSNYYAIFATNSVTDVDSPSSDLTPRDFVLNQNYPNPFNPSTMIQFQLPVQSDVKLSIYNLLGQQIAILVDEIKSAGVYTVQWNGQDASGRFVSSGIYLVKLEAGGQIKVRRMALLK
jgi:hypothetical protein